jgi:hypothetical protein
MLPFPCPWQRKSLSALNQFRLPHQQLVDRLRKHMIALKRQTAPRSTDKKMGVLRKTPKAKFGVFGEEMIEKEVKPAGNSGRVYLPLDWVGKHVKIIRID